MDVTALSKNVMRIPPQGNMSRETYAKRLMQYLDYEKKIYFIDYVDDYSLPYCVPITPGEYIVSHGYVEDSLMSLGGESLVQKVGSLGWFLILLIELCPINFDVDKAYDYMDEFDVEEFDPDMPEGSLDFLLWQCYHVLTGSDLYIFTDQQFTAEVDQLKDLNPMVQQIIYSYIVRTFIMNGVEFESDPFMDAFRSYDFRVLYANAITYANGVNQNGIHFGTLQIYTPPSVLFAEWYLQGYSKVTPRDNIDFNTKYEEEVLEKFTDLELSTYSGVIDYYLSRSDLFYIVYDAFEALDGVVPTITNGKLVIAHRGNTHDIIKVHGYDGQTPTYRLEPEIPSVKSEIIGILTIIDYKNDHSTLYDRIRNPYQFYKNPNELINNIVFYYLLYLVQKGKYEGSYGTPANRKDSYLYKRILADYTNYILGSNYYKIPVGIVENGILIQSNLSIDNAAKYDIKYEDIANTAMLYAIDLDRVFQEAARIWDLKYKEGNGNLRIEVEDYKYNAINYREMNAYIEYVKRLSEYIYDHNEAKKLEPEIVLYTEENLDQAEEEVYEDNFYRG